MGKGRILTEAKQEAGDHKEIAIGGGVDASTGHEQRYRRRQAALAISATALAGISSLIPVFREHLQDYFGL